MNERIRKLAKKAGFSLDSNHIYTAKLEHLPITKNMEQFAELIVRECCEVLEQTQDALDRQKWPTPRGCTEYIKEHFGVE